MNKKYFIFFVMICALAIPIGQNNTTMKNNVTHLVMSIAGLLFTATIGFSQTATDHANTLFWKVTGKDATKPAYIYGTFHMLCPEDAKLADTLRQVVSSCSSVYLELDFDDPKMPKEIQAGMMMKNGRTWKDFTAVANYNRLDSGLKALAGLPADAVCSIQPIALISMLYAPLMQCQIVSVESQFAQLASEAQLPIHGLESVATQLAIFDQIPIQQQLEILEEYVLDKNKMRAETEELLQAYLAGDIDRVYEFVKKAEMEMEGLEEIMLTHRNKTWMSTFENNMKKAPTFYAVGAGHLGGENGVLELLKKMGYTVSPIFIH